MPFDTKLNLQSIRGTNKYLLISMLKFWSKKTGIIIRTPMGTITDFASIPPIVKPFVDDDDGEIRDGAVMHDFLYSKESDKAYPEIDRMQADELFLEAMKDLGAGWFKRNMIYSAVVAFGWMFYKKDEVDA